MLIKKKKTQQLNFFVSIGAGLNQIPLIIEAKKLKFHVIGVDYNTAAPGFYSCDLKIQESIENHDALYKKLRELLVDGDIIGIMTKSYGPAIVTTSYLTEKFNIPFLPFHASEYFINKKKMKAVFAQHGIKTSQLILQTAKTKLEKIPEAQYPLIVKPSLGHAKFNVRLVHNFKELQGFLNAQDNAREYVLEHFVQGDEIVTAGIIHNKKYYLVEITDKKTKYPPYFIDMIHSSPSKYSHLAAKLEKIGQMLTDAFSIKNSPFIMELIITKNEEIFLIEAVPEFGGEFIPDILIPAGCGYNIIGEAIRSMTNKNFKPPASVRKNKNAVVVRYITGEAGVLASCNPEGPRNVKGTIFSRIFKEIGSRINEPVTNLDRLGVVIVTAPTVDNAIALSEKAADNFNIRIKP
jgi:biotin carboxylase